MNRQELNFMQARLEGITLNAEPGVLLWRDGIEKIIVKECYTRIMVLILFFFNEGVCCFDWKTVRLNEVPSKVNFLV